MSMPFSYKQRAYKATIGAVMIGAGENTITIGGQNVMPLCRFDGEAGYRPAIGVEVTDIGFDVAGLPRLAFFYEGAEDIITRAHRAATIEGADFICLRFEGADPAGYNRSVQDCVADTKAVYETCGKPLVITGCKNIEKDTTLFTAIAEALSGANALFLSAREEDYKAIGAAVALAYGHRVGAESAVDINLAKQLSVLLTQLGVPAVSMVMNLGTAAAGYGFEYVASTMDRVKSAALEQNDTMLQIPVITPVSTEAWSVKESVMPEDDMPEWGSQEDRGIHMETVTAAACLASGSDAVILRHPASIKTISALISALM
jgi:acetyl-CoA decarbonylase/synthase complex subunit delta